MRPTTASDTEAPVASDNSMTMNGVSTMPSRFDPAAAPNSPEALPRDMAVKANDEWTVERSSERNSMPAQSGWANKPGRTTGRRTIRNKAIRDKTYPYVTYQ